MWNVYTPPGRRGGGLSNFRRMPPGVITTVNDTTKLQATAAQKYQVTDSYQYRDSTDK